MKFFITLSIMISLVLNTNKNKKFLDYIMDGSHNGLCWNVCKYLCYNCNNKFASGYNNEANTYQELICICHEMEHELKTKYPLGPKVDTLYSRTCNIDFKEKVDCKNYVPKKQN